jgi:hypothetical protein
MVNSGAVELEVCVTASAEHSRDRTGNRELSSQRNKSLFSFLHSNCISTSAYYWAPLSRSPTMPSFICTQVTHDALMCRAGLQGRVSDPIPGQPDLKESTHSLSLTQQVLCRDNPLFFNIGPFLAPRLTQHECLTAILQHDCLATRSQQDIENRIDIPPMHESTLVGSRPCNNPTAGPSS